GRDLVHVRSQVAVLQEGGGGRLHDRFALAGRATVLHCPDSTGQFSTRSGTVRSSSQGGRAMSSVTSADGTTIAFDRSGSGPALVLVGGAFQHRALDPRTAQLAELLASQLAVYHYDRRGRGDSGDTPPYAVEREIEDLAALIDDAGGSASVFGMSSGANLALRAAA